MADEHAPPVWVGHVSHPTSDPDRAARWYEAVGMRRVFTNDDIAIMELRGGTHLALSRGELEGGTRPASFDLMVEDLDAVHAAWTDAGLAPSAITSGRVHSSFTVTDPDGYVVTVNSSHVAGPV